MLRTAAYCSSSVIVRPFTGEAIPQVMMRYYFDGILRQLGICVVAEGTDRIGDAPPSIIVVNHNSLLDIPCLGVILDFDYKWVSKKEIFQIPFVGWHLRACGHIWVDRSRKDNYERLDDEFHRRLTSGASILMFPEGTRSPNGALRKFHSGAFVTAVREQVPILPIVLDGTDRLLVKGSLAFPGGQDKIVRVRVLDRIYPEANEAFTTQVRLLRDATRTVMVTALDDLRGGPGRAEQPAARL
jgi:1-acyl-sn-glycerol-3-phosphate acyltransferase